jgi:hypothetical protein
MPSVDITPDPQTNLKTGNESLLDGILQVLDKVNSTIDKINNNPMVKQFISKNNTGNTITSSIEAKQYKNRPQPALTDPGESKKKSNVLDPDQITEFLSTPEGKKQICNGIDELINLTGDVRLSKLQEYLKKGAESNESTDQS